MEFIRKAATIGRSIWLIWSKDPIGNVKSDMKEMAHDGT